MNRTNAALFAVGSVLAATTVGSSYGPTPNRPFTALWYARLRKPSFTPPGPAFGAAWTVLDGLLCYSGYRVLIRPSAPRRNIAVGFWGLNVLALGAFPFFLFGRKRLGESLGVTSLMVATSTAFVASAKSVDRPAAISGLPLALWTLFAAALQEEVWRRNRS
jgi:benzodiazapine receptor